MTTIVKKGTCPSIFRLRSGKIITLEVSPVLNFIDDVSFEDLMVEYGNFIKERVISDKNPNGCFIIGVKPENAKAQDVEVGEEIKDNSAPIEVEAPSLEDLKATAQALGIRGYASMKLETLQARIAEKQG